MALLRVLAVILSAAKDPGTAPPTHGLREYFPPVPGLWFNGCISLCAWPVRSTLSSWPRALLLGAVQNHAALLALLKKTSTVP